jgi:hypothetical protein
MFVYGIGQRAQSAVAATSDVNAPSKIAGAIDCKGWSASAGGARDSFTVDFANAAVTELTIRKTSSG